MIEHRDRIVHLAACCDEEGLVSDQAFFNCYIAGPALLLSVGGLILEDCAIPIRFEDHNRAFWEVPAGTFKFGAIGLRNVRFHGCTFNENVAWAGTPQSLATMKSQLFSHGEG